MMTEQMILMDDQPIAATFFNEGKWLTEFITPDALEVKKLYREITKSIEGTENKVRVCHQWVANNIKYKQFIAGKLWVEGKASVQRDLWLSPSLVKRVRVGNCANKAFLLTSLLRNELGPNQVYCVLGNLYNGKAGGHAWSQVILNDRTYISDATSADTHPLVIAGFADRYEPVHLFNDKIAYAIEGKTVMEPFTACYSTWLKDYLDWSYIEGKKNGR